MKNKLVIASLLLIASASFAAEISYTGGNVKFSGTVTTETMQTGDDVVPSLPGEFVRSAGAFATAGDAQVRNIAMKTQTTSNTAMPLLCSDGSKLIIPTNTSWAVTALIVARGGTPTTQYAAFVVNAYVANNSGNISHNTVLTKIFSSSTSYQVSAAIDNVGKSYSINCKGYTGHNINWVADVRVVQAQ